MLRSAGTIAGGGCSRGRLVYCCFEGQSGIQTRVEAFGRRFLPEDVEDVPFFLQPVTMDLVKEHGELIAAIRTH